MGIEKGLRSMLGCRDGGVRGKFKRGDVKRDLERERIIDAWIRRRSLEGKEMDVRLGEVKEEGNQTKTETGTYDDMLRICWSKQECWNCLDTSSMKSYDGKGEVGCSWCPSVGSLFIRVLAIPLRALKLYLVTLMHMSHPTI